jgi:translation elongation factor EF-1beta
VIEEELKKLNITLIELKDKVGYTDRTDEIINAIEKVNKRIENLEEELNQSKRR